MPRYVELEIELRDAQPRIWRKFQIRGSLTLLELHDAIQIACGWTESHLFSFYEWFENRYQQRPKELARSPDGEAMGTSDGPLAFDVNIDEVFRKLGDRAVYIYDHGDNWEHNVTVTKAFIETKGTFRRKLLDGARAFPPEDCGSTPGYEELVIAFDNEGNGLDEEQEYTLKWLRGFDPDWTPERFDIAAVKKKFDRKR